MQNNHKIYFTHYYILNLLIFAKFNGESLQIYTMLLKEKNPFPCKVDKDFSADKIESPSHEKKSFIIKNIFELSDI